MIEKEALGVEFEKPWENPLDENHVGYQLKMLDRMFCKQMMKLIREEEYEGITMLSGWIMEYLAFREHEVTYQKDIEKTFRTGKSTIAGAMKLLEKYGFIVRNAVKGDARLKQVCLTNAGEAYIQRIKQRKIQMEQRVTKGLSRQEITDFLNIVKKMQANLAD